MQWMIKFRLGIDHQGDGKTQTYYWKRSLAANKRVRPQIPANLAASNWFNKIIIIFNI